MANQTKPGSEVVFSMEVDRYFEFVDQAVIIASAGSRHGVRPSANAPILTVQADEMTDFSQDALPVGKPPSCGDQKRESA